jgi:hypothetical protein
MRIASKNTRASFIGENVYVYGSISISKSIDITLYPKSKSKLQF